MKPDRGALLLYAVTDRAWAKEHALLQQVEWALQGGVTCVQLREKGLDRAAFMREAVAMQALCRGFQVPFVVNDDVDIAIACGADGVHVGQGDMDAVRVRARIGPDMALGVSVQTVDQALSAQAAGADYLGVGAVFATATKPDAVDVSPETLRAICRAASVPVVAIGGITYENMEALAGSGIHGVALVSDIFSAPDIEKKCALLRARARKVVGP